jgi:hypothetical protein
MVDKMVTSTRTTGRTLTIMKIHRHPFSPPTPFIRESAHARILLKPEASRANK